LNSRSDTLTRSSQTNLSNRFEVRTPLGRRGGNPAILRRYGLANVSTYLSSPCQTAPGHRANSAYPLTRSPWIWKLPEDPPTRRLAACRLSPARFSPGRLSRSSGRSCQPITPAKLRVSKMVEADGIEPTTPCLQSRCSPTELRPRPDLPERTGRTVEKWWAREDLYFRPHSYQARALTN